MKVTKKPVTVDAHRFDGDIEAVQGWLNDLWDEYGEPDSLDMQYHHAECNCDPANLDTAGVLDAAHILIRTLEGPLFVAVGAWIVRGVQGEFYPVKDSILRETYHLPEGV